VAKSGIPHQGWIFGGSASPELAQRMAELLHLPFAQVVLTRFPDGEVKPCVRGSLERQVAILVQATSPPVNDHLVELLLTIEALCGAGSRKVVAVVPYFGYARQCRRNTPDEPVSARLVLQMIKHAGAQAIIALDLHEPSITRFAEIPVWNVGVEGAMTDYIRASFPMEREPVIVSPDRGGARRAEAVAQRLGLPKVVLEKRRETPAGVAQSVVSEATIGSLQGRGAIIVDDMVATGGTLPAAVQTLREEGADVLGAVCTHGVLCRRAIDRLWAGGLPKLAVSDSLPGSTLPPILDRFSIVPLLAQALGEILMRVS